MVPMSVSPIVSFPTTKMIQEVSPSKSNPPYLHLSFSKQAICQVRENDIYKIITLYKRNTLKKHSHMIPMPLLTDGLMPEPATNPW